MFAPIATLLFIALAMINNLYAITQAEVDFYNLLQLKNLEVFNNTRIHGNLIVNGVITSSGISGGGGSVNLIGGAATVNAAARFANTSGDIKNSSVLIDDSGNVTLNGITKNGNTVSWPTIVGAAGTVLTSDGAGNLIYSSPAGAGNVSTALAFTTDNLLLRTDTPNGATNIKESGITLDNSNNISGVNTLTATTFIGSLTGNATSATNFSGSLAGDVSGTQGATVVNFVGGQSAANVASATVLANAATNANTPSTIVRRDASGNFIAGTITANLTGNVTGNLTGNATTATSATTATNFTGSLVGDVTGTQGATVVSTVGGQTAANVASATILANAATSSNTASAIVRRDGSGNFSAGTITANLNGNATTATSATSATTATNFTGSLVGDVTGTQGATVVSLVGGQTAANVASATVLANAATSANTANAIVRRDASGNFVAGTITANLAGNATTATTAGSATNFTGSLVGDVTGTQGATVVSLVGGQSAANVASATVLANAATNTNTANTIVRRDASGNFIAGTITANLTGNVTGNLTGNATTATSATTATNFTGSLVGDVTGTQGATVVSTVGGQTAANIASATVLANAATSNNTPSTIVRRDGSGNFTASTITADTGFVGDVTGNLFGNATTAISATTATTATNFTGSLAGDVTGTQGATVVSFVGGQSAANVASATVAANAATSNNTANTIVKRDALGNFITNMITISGTVSNPTDVTTKDYVDNAVASGFTVHDPAVVVSTTNVALTGLQTIDGVLLVDNDRVLLVGQTDPVENGLWVAHAGAWTRPTDFASGDTAGTAYVLILSGTTEGGSSWVCNTPAAIIDTDPITFAQFSTPSQVTGANVGAGTGQIFRDKTGITLNFKTLAAGPHITITNNPNDVTIETDATSANTPSTIVARDGTGTFAGSLTGAASLNVLKAGDTMTGNLNMATQNEVRFQDAAGGEYVGLHAPATVNASYSISLPSDAPTVGEVLQATSPSATIWAIIGGDPTVAKTYYVALNGSDTNDGSFNSPFLTISHAVSVANGVASASNPILISIGSGIFVEDNSGGPINVTADGIAIIGSSIATTIVIPTDFSNNLFNVTVANIKFSEMALQTPVPGSTATAINLSSDAFGSPRFNSLAIGQFQTGVALSSSTANPVPIFENYQAGGNGTSIDINNMQAVIKNSLFAGPFVAGPVSNTGIAIAGASSSVAIISCIFQAFNDTITIDGGGILRVNACDIDLPNNGIVCSGGSSASITSCNFQFNNVGSIDISATGAGTDVAIEGCNLQCADQTGTPQGTGLFVTTGAAIEIDSCVFEEAVLGIQCGAPGDTSSTEVIATDVILQDCTTDIVQEGTSTLQFFTGLFNPQTITINDSTNVRLASFEEEGNLAIGNNSDTTYTLYEVLNGEANEPILVYEPNYYGNQGTVFRNQTPDPIFNATEGPTSDAYYFVNTGDRTKEAGINLISDTANIGNSDNVRGWNITKVGSSANLNFTYSNNDTSGQAARGANAVMTLNGFDNQVEFPTAANAPLPTNTVAQLVWASDTNLYRAAAALLKTDGNLSVGGLSSTGVVHNDNTGLLSTSLIVNADVDPAAAIVDTKLATISTAGKVANSATTATSANTANAIVARDASGNFSAGTITASLTGAASLNVLKAGDTMTGNLNMATQTEVRFQDAAGGQYVGLNAPTTVGTSYTVNLPSSAPTSGQVLQATSPSATTWATVGGGSPTATKTYYVSKAGNDSNDGSFNSPFLTVSHAVTVANGVASSSNPIVIDVGPGIFAENNTGGPITISSSGISIVGSSVSGTTITPFSAANDLFSITTPSVEMDNFTILLSGVGSTGNAITMTTTTSGIARFNTLTILGAFQTGIALSSSVFTSVSFNNMLCSGATTILSVDNFQCVIKNSLFQGSFTALPANTGLSITGSATQVFALSNLFRFFDTAITITGGAALRILGSTLESSTNGIIGQGGSNTEVVGCNFVFNSASSINVTASGASTILNLIGCSFDGRDSTNTPQGTALHVTGDAMTIVDACTLNNLVVGIHCGVPGDTITTFVQSDATTINNCTTHILQEGAAKLAFTSGIFKPDQVTINDPTNVSFAAFDDDGIIEIGSTANEQHTLYEILNGQMSNEPELVYEPNYYGNQGTSFKNRTADPVFNAVEAPSHNAYYYAITGDRTREAGINLISDTANIGSSDNVRGWNLIKEGTSANLAFFYSNTDTSGQAARGVNAVMRLNGFDNQIEFPTAANAPLPTNTVAKLVWATDTNLYRSAGGLLKTDGNLSVGGLSSTGVVHNDNTGLLSTSLIVNADVNAAAAIAYSKLNLTNSIVNADINASAGIADTKLATISTAGKVLNSATTATSLNTANAIVARDASGNFSAGTITASLTGAASLNVLKAGDTMTGTLTLPAGTTAAPSLQFTGSTNTGLSAPTANNLSFSTNGSERMDISSAGVVAINNLTPAGVVHNDASGNLTTSLIVNADVNAAAAIVDTKLATISTAGKVANSATTATSANTANAIVARDASGNFSAGTITASLTGAASLNVLKAGDTMTGTLIHPAGSAAAPSIQFTGSTNTGFSAATANTLSFDTNGTERLSISTTKIIKTLATADQAIQSVTPTTGGSVTTNTSTSILLLKHAGAVTNFTVTFPPSPVDGQLFSIVLGTTSSITLINAGGTGGASIVNAVTALNPATTPPTNVTANTSVTYLYSSTANTWYRFSRG